MLTKADHDFITDLRSRGCAVVVYTRAEVERVGAKAWELEEALLEKANSILVTWDFDHDLELTSEELEDKHGDEHPSYPRSEWLAEVGQIEGTPGDYWPWVWLQLDNGRELS